jgi:PAS domain S-box-containing protein
MGLFTAILIAIGGACFVLLLLQVLVAVRQGSGNYYIFGASTSVVFFLFALIAIFTSNVDYLEDHLLPGLKMQSIMAFVVMIAFVGMTYQVLPGKNRRIAFTGIVLLLLIAMIVLTMPEYILFGTDAGLNFMVLATGERFLMIAPGITVWRQAVNLAVVVTVIFSGIMIWKNYLRNGKRFVPALVSGLLVILMSAFADQLIDLGSVQSYYILPFGMAVNYFILAIIPFAQLSEDISLRKDQSDTDRKWRTLIHQANVVVVVLNRMGHVEFINPFFLKLTGFRESEVVGKDWFEFFVPSDQYYDVQSAFIEILEFDFHPHYRNPILTKYHEKRMIDWYNVRLRDSNEQVTGSISFGFDITDEAEEKEILRNKLREMEQIIQQMREGGRL